METQVNSKSKFYSISLNKTFEKYNPIISNRISKADIISSDIKNLDEPSLISKKTTYRNKITYKIKSG